MSHEHDVDFWLEVRHCTRQLGHTFTQAAVARNRFQYAAT